MGAFWPTRMTHSIAQQPIVYLHMLPSVISNLSTIFEATLATQISLVLP